MPSSTYHLKITPQKSKKITAGIPPTLDSTRVCKLTLILRFAKSLMKFAAKRAITPCKAEKISAAINLLVFSIEIKTARPAIKNKQ